MEALDLTLPIKRLIIDHLASDPVVLALVPLERIFAMAPPGDPEWPFIRYGSPISSPSGATCWEGTATRVTLHGFAETNNDYAGEDRALEIAAAIVQSMKTFAPADYMLVDLEWLGTQCVRDEPEADRWHSMTEFNVTLASTY